MAQSYSTSDFSGEMLSPWLGNHHIPESSGFSGEMVECTGIGNNLPPSFISRIQSHRLYDDSSTIPNKELARILDRDLERRVIQVNTFIADKLFPDDAFGFPLTAEFAMNFTSAFLSPDGGINAANFATDKLTAWYLNSMVTTMARFLRCSRQSDLYPLRYFSPSNADKPLEGESSLKPDITLVRLIDGCTHKGNLIWPDVQAFIENTREQQPPPRMPTTVNLKTYQMFCSQPERDFVVCLCITREGFHIVVSTHAAQFETDVIGFGPNSNIPFLRMVMGMAFLSDDLIGVDTTMIRRCDSTLSSGEKLEDLYPPFPANSSIPQSLKFTIPMARRPELAVTYDLAEEGFDKDFSHIMVDDRSYKVICVLFRSQALIGRATKTFLVEFPDGTRGILKDSWGIDGRTSEAEFIGGLEIHFGPSLIDSCSLRTTRLFQPCILTDLLVIINECRVKRRVVTSPAGVHISDFSSLWELMVAFLDVVIAIMCLETQQKLHRDISYTNILLREPEPRTKEKRAELMQELGLSKIEQLREELGCREGLLIDYDNAGLIVEPETHAEPATQGKGKNKVDQQKEEIKCSGHRTGTLPFIAIELLKCGVPHRVAHDLESIIYVLLFIASHLDAPRNSVRNPPLYNVGEKKGQHGGYRHPSGMKEWFEHSNNVSLLGDIKLSHMVITFETQILGGISPYFKSISLYIDKLWRRILPDRKTTIADQGFSSNVTCKDIIEVFKTALLDPALIDEAKKVKLDPTVLGKRARPGDLITAPNGWDAVNAKRNSNAKPKLQMSRPKRKLMMKKRG